MAILLESDAEKAIQSHLNDFSKRAGFVFVLVAVLTVIWSFFIDDVLKTFLQSLQPCEDDCLNVYGPAHWTEVRWLSSLFLGFFSTMPVMFHQFRAFAKTGLTKDEQRALTRIATLGCLMFVGGFFLLTTKLLPILFTFGHNANISSGLTPEYNAVEMLTIATYLTWMFALVFGTWFILIMAGRMNILTKATADWWRIRTYGIAGLLMLLTVPAQAQALSIPMVVFLVAGGEVVARPWLTQSGIVKGRLSEWFDDDGRRRKLVIVETDGAHSAYTPEQAAELGVAILTVNSLQHSQEDRERVLLFLSHARITDLIVCGVEPNIHESLFENFQRMGITLHQEGWDAGVVLEHPFVSLLGDNAPR